MAHVYRLYIASVKLFFCKHLKMLIEKAGSKSIHIFWCCNFDISPLPNKEMNLMPQFNKKLTGRNRIGYPPLLSLSMSPQNFLHGVALRRLSNIHGTSIVALPATFAVLTI